MLYVGRLYVVIPNKKTPQVTTAAIFIKLYALTGWSVYRKSLTYEFQHKIYYIFI